jgi:hypothetical protein
MLEVACRSSFDMAASSQPILKVPLEPQRGNPCCLWEDLTGGVFEGSMTNPGPFGPQDDRHDEPPEAVRRRSMGPPVRRNQRGAVDVHPTPSLSLIRAAQPSPSSPDVQTSREAWSSIPSTARARPRPR